MITDREILECAAIGLEIQMRRVQGMLGTAPRANGDDGRGRFERSPEVRAKMAAAQRASWKRRKRKAS